MRGLNNLSVYARIGLLGALVAFTLIALAATIWYSDFATSRALARQQNFADIERLSLEMEIGALDMRRREKDFLLRRETQYRDRYFEAADTVAGLLEGISALDAPAGIDAADDRLAEALPRHRAIFTDIVERQIALGLTQDEGLEGQLRTAVHDVEERLQRFQDDGLMVLMLMMRRHEKDFMLRGSARYIDEFDARQAEFAAMLAQRDYAESDKADITRLMARYSAGFHAWAESKVEFLSVMTDLSEVFAEMDPDFTLIVETAREGGRIAIADLAAERNHIRIVTASIIALIALTAGLLCWTVGRSIARPINALTRAMGELTRGKTDGVIPATDQGGEIGQMASAILVFQKNQIEVDRLRAEQALAEGRAAEEKMPHHA